MYTNILIHVQKKKKNDFQCIWTGLGLLDNKSKKFEMETESVLTVIIYYH